MEDSSSEDTAKHLVPFNQRLLQSHQLPWATTCPFFGSLSKSPCSFSLSAAENQDFLRKACTWITPTQSQHPECAQLSVGLLGLLQAGIVSLSLLRKIWIPPSPAGCSRRGLPSGTAAEPAQPGKMHLAVPWKCQWDHGNPAWATPGVG